MKQFTIGRGKENDIIIDDATVSRQHATIIQTEDGLFISDNGSSNGTFINGNRIQGEARLNPNDILKLGTVLIPWKQYFSVESKSDEGRTKIVEERTSRPNKPNDQQGQTNSSVPISQQIPAPKKKNKTARVLIVVAVLFVILSAIGIGINNSSRSYNNSANPVIENEFVEYIEKGIANKTLLGHVVVSNKSNHSGNVDIIATCTQEDQSWERTKTVYLYPGEEIEVVFEFPEVKRLKYEPTFSAIALATY